MGFKLHVDLSNVYWFYWFILVACLFPLYVCVGNTVFCISHGSWKGQFCLTLMSSISCSQYILRYKDFNQEGCNISIHKCSHQNASCYTWNVIHLYTVIFWQPTTVSLSRFSILFISFFLLSSCLILHTYRFQCFSPPECFRHHLDSQSVSPSAHPSSERQQHTHRAQKQTIHPS